MYPAPSIAARTQTLPTAHHDSTIGQPAAVNGLWHDGGPTAFPPLSQASWPQTAYNGTNYAQFTESRQPVKSAMQGVASARSSFERQLERLAPGKPQEALTMLKADAGYTGYVNQMGDVSEVNSVEKILGEVTKLKAQASALITRLNKAYEQNNSPEIFRLQAQLPPVLGQLEREYRSLSFRAEAANPIESNDSLCNRMDEVIGDYLTAGEFDHSTKAAHFSTLSSMAKELSFPLHPIDDASCAGTVRDVHIITKLERERNTPPQTETAP